MIHPLSEAGISFDFLTISKPNCKQLFQISLKYSIILHVSFQIMPRLLPFGILPQIIPSLKPLRGLRDEKEGGGAEQGQGGGRRRTLF